MLSVQRFCVVDNGYKPVTVTTNIEYYIAIDIISIGEESAKFGKIIPPDQLGNANPCFDLVRCIWILLHCFMQMLSRNEIHGTNLLHKS